MFLSQTHDDNTVRAVFSQLSAWAVQSKSRREIINTLEAKRKVASQTAIWKAWTRFSAKRRQLNAVQG